MFELFHDESGFAQGDRWGVHGMLAIPADRVDAIAAALAQVRRTRGYYSEVHLKDVGGARWKDSKRFLVARDWLRLFFEHLAWDARYKAFAIDMRHADFDRERYPTPLAAYRRFFISDAKALVAWCLRGEGTLRIVPYTDAGNSYAAKKRKRDKTLFDSFARYVEHECKKEREVNNKEFYPSSVVVERLEAIDSNPSRLTAARAAELRLSVPALVQRSDLIQLTDLLTSSLGAALTLSPANEGKQRLAELVVGYHASAFELQWGRMVVARRRFSLSCFPGPGRTPYAVSLRGIRQHGLARLREDEQLATLMSPLEGFRPDAVGVSQFDLDELVAADEARRILLKA